MNTTYCKDGFDAALILLVSTAWKQWSNWHESTSPTEPDGSAWPISLALVSDNLKATGHSTLWYTIGYRFLPSFKIIRFTPAPIKYGHAPPPCLAVKICLELCISYFLFPHFYWPISAALSCGITTAQVYTCYDSCLNLFGASCAYAKIKCMIQCGAVRLCYLFALIPTLELRN